MTNQLKEKLIESEERYRIVTEQTGQLIYDYDIPSGKIEWFGKTKQLIGYSKKEMDAFGITGWEKMIHEEDRKQAVEELDKAFKKGDKYNVVYRFQKKDGTYIKVADSGVFVKNKKGKLSRMLGVMKDVTEEYFNVRKMEESEKKYKAFVERSNDGVALLQEGKVVFINSKLEKMFGWTRKDAVGKSFLNFIYPTEVEKVQTMYEERLRGKKVPAIYESTMVNKNHEPIFVELNAGLIDYNGKKADLVYVRDVSERKKILDDVKEEKEKAEGYLNIAGSIILAMDIDGKITLINKMGNKLLGYKEGELIGKNWISLCIPKSQGKMVREVFQQVLSGKKKFPEHFVNNVATKTGEERIISWNNSRILDDENKLIGILSAGEDVTDKIKAEEELKNSEMILKTVLEGSPIPNFYIDKNHRIVYWNKTLEKFSGIKAKDAIGTDIQWKVFYEKKRPCMADLVVDNNIDAIKQLYAGIYKKSELIPNAYEAVDYFPGIGKNGAWLSFTAAQIRDVKGNVIGALESLEDITEMKLSEHALIEKMEDIRIEKEKTEKIIYGIGDGVFVLDKNYKILLFNNAAENISGYTHKEAFGKHFSKILKFVSETDNTDKSGFLQNTIETGISHKMENHTLLITKSGEKVPIADSCAPLKDREGKVIGGVVVFRDVTEERKIDQMKNEFISLASHQLRTPLSGIKWFIELLLQGKAGELTIQQKDYLTQVAQSNERMISLIEDLLSVSHIETGKKFVIEKEKAHPSDFVEESLIDLTPLAEQYGIKLVSKITKNCNCTIFVDKDKILQVYYNLLSNAIKYSKKGGKVIISCNSDKNSVIVSIQDFGYGIPKKQQKRVFEKFFRADNILTKQTDGTGLGLYIAKAIVEANGGEMWFKSEENKGTTFYFSLPKKK